MTKITYNEQELRLVQSRYQNNNALYVGLVDNDGEFYADVTVNMPISSTMPTDCAFVDTNNLSWKIIEVLTDAGIVTPIHQTCRSGFYQYHAFRFQNLWDIDDITAAIN
jgi:hypothetical protein